MACVCVWQGSLTLLYCPLVCFKKRGKASTIVHHEDSTLGPLGRDAGLLQIQEDLRGQKSFPLGLQQVENVKPFPTFKKALASLTCILLLLAIFADISDAYNNG